MMGVWYSLMLIRGTEAEDYPLQEYQLYLPLATVCVVIRVHLLAKAGQACKQLRVGALC